MVSRREILKFGTLGAAGSLLVGQQGVIQSANADSLECQSAVVKNGVRIADFSGTKWSPLWSGNPSFERDYNVTQGVHSPTGARTMLRWGPIADNYEDIHIRYTDLPGQSPLVLNGRFGIWVYCEAQPGYEPGATADSVLDIVLTTNPGGDFSNAVDIGFNSNQIREGWNFLKFVDNPIGHPLGIEKNFWGDGSDGDIINNPVYEILIYSEHQDIGLTWYFDSLWTGFETTPQVVLGCDDYESDLLDHCLPKFQSYGWVGYIAAAYRVWESGPTQVTDWDQTAPILSAMADAGWDIINHSVNHLRMGDLTNSSDIQYEIYAQDTWLRSLKIPTQGLKFYAAPQGSTSRLSEATIKDSGIEAQRHFRKWNTSVTQFGIDNPHHMGSLGMEDVEFAQTFDNIKKWIDIIIIYEDTLHLFWHKLITQGDPGDGTGTTGSYSTMYQSNWDMAIEYIRSLELAGKITVPKGLSGFY
jgi:peptidoglycan/xylan/chitin deacetylase (PgdA/CDA1 family)